MQAFHLCVIAVRDRTDDKHPSIILPRRTRADFPDIDFRRRARRSRVRPVIDQLAGLELQRSRPRVTVAMTAASKQDRYRARVATLEIVVEALIQQARDHGLTEQQAKAEIGDLIKRREAMDNVLIKWARMYLKK
jgi:hypothetical protein